MAGCGFDQSSPGCRPITYLGFYEMIHWERNEHHVNNQNGTQQSPIGAPLIYRLISCHFHLFLPLPLCQEQFVFWLVRFSRAVVYEWRKGKQNLISHYLLSFQDSIKEFWEKAGEGPGKDTYLFLVQLLYLTLRSRASNCTYQNFSLGRSYQAIWSCFWMLVYCIANLHIV